MGCSLIPSQVVAPYKGRANTVTCITSSSHYTGHHIATIYLKIKEASFFCLSIRFTIEIKSVLTTCISQFIESRWKGNRSRISDPIRRIVPFIISVSLCFIMGQSNSRKRFIDAIISIRPIRVCCYRRNGI